MGKNGQGLKRAVQIVARFLILLFFFVGIYALCNGKIEKNYIKEQDFSSNQYVTPIDHYFCPNCNTIVPCPYSHNGVGISCPSCGYKTEIIRRGGSAQNMGGVYGSNYYGTGGLGRNGGMGLGPGGNLICPDCGYIMPHQRGVPSYTVQCPQCGTTMARKIAASNSTAFYNINSNNPSLQNRNGVASGAQAPPITSDAVMPHVYQGVCSKCHQIIDIPK